MRQYLWKHFGVELIDDFINGIGLDMTLLRYFRLYNTVVGTRQLPKRHEVN